jgi:nicotinate-nucleotide adenylyltransferase
MRLVIGADVLADLDKWHRFDRIAELAPPLVIPRASAMHGDRVSRHILPDASSTEVRALFDSKDTRELTEILPSKVLAYAETHRLYGHPKRGEST